MGRAPLDYAYDLLLATRRSPVVVHAVCELRRIQSRLLPRNDPQRRLRDGSRRRRRARRHDLRREFFDVPARALGPRPDARANGSISATLVKRQTHDTARAVNLFDRGVIAAGMKADLNVIDFANLRVRAPEMIKDLPAGGSRLEQRADGYLATIVSGEVTYRNGEPTDALPGRLVR